MSTRIRRLVSWVSPAVAAGALVVAAAGCGGYRFELTKDRQIPQLLMDVQPVDLKVGERRKLLTVVGTPSGWGYAPGFVSSRPEVVRVVYAEERGGSDIWLEGVSPGEARIALCNAWMRETATWESETGDKDFVPEHDSFVVRCVSGR